MLVVGWAGAAADAAPLYLATPVSDSGIGNTISSPNTSRTVAVAPDGTIYAAYHGTQGIRVARSLNNGATFEPTVQLTSLNAQVEIAADENNVVYLAWKVSGNVVISRSTDGGQTFSSPAVVGAASGSAVHMATDAPYVYVVPQNGSVLFVNGSSGVGPFVVHGTGSSGVFSDVCVDPATHRVYVLMDNTVMHYVASSDRGQTFGSVVTPGGSTQFPACAISAGAAGLYAFMGGIGAAGYGIDLNTGQSTAMALGDSGLTTGRSLAADALGNVADGYCYNSETFFRVSNDLGTTFEPPVKIASGSNYTCVAINRRRSDIIAVYEQSGRIYASVYATGSTPENRPPDAYAGPVIIVEQTSPNGTPVTLDGSASTDPDGDALTYTWMENGSVIAGPTMEASSVVTLQLGTHEITLIVDDGKGGTDQIVISVTVADTFPPDMILPPDLVIEATGIDGAEADLGAPVVSDVCDAAPLVTTNAPDIFPLGTTYVIWTATDASGNSTRMPQFATVVDTTAPSIEVPETVIAEQESGDGTVIALATPVVFDVCDLAPQLTNDAPAIFPLGTTIVTWTATDASANSATASQMIIVQDTTPPSIQAPADTMAEQANANGTSALLGEPTVSDICDAAPEVSNDARAVLPLGTTLVTWTATDESGNSASATQTVTIVDTTPPTLTLPADITVPKDDSAGATVTFTVTAGDICDAAPRVQCDPPSGSRFPIGTTLVSCSACDASGNASSGTFNVTVTKKKAPPKVKLSTRTTSIWPALGWMVNVGLNLTVKDANDPAPTVQMSVTQQNSRASKQKVRAIAEAAVAAGVPLAYDSTEGATSRK